MSFKDDSKPDREVFFTPSGKFAKGHPGLYKGKQLQQDEQSDIPPFDGDFDDAIIYVAETYSGKPRVFVGLLAVVEDLRRNKATEFASYLRQAYANRKQKRETNTVTPGVQIGFLIAACGDCVDAEGKQLLSADETRAAWERKHGITLTSYEPPPPPPAQPVLVSPRDDDEDYDQQPYTLDEVKRMTKEQFDAALAAGEIVVVDEDR